VVAEFAATATDEIGAIITAAPTKNTLRILSFPQLSKSLSSDYSVHA
jgi:hypothetical protein